MILGIAGSRSLSYPLPDELMPPYIDMIISGGAKGIDTCAKEYALENHIRITEILPEYELYGRRAPLLRNDHIIDMSDVVYIFWDKKSEGSRYVINKCIKTKTPYKVFTWENGRYILMK